MSQARSRSRSRSRSLSLLALVTFTGCISYCRFDPVLERARRGDRSAISEAGELGRPRVPSTAEHLPSVLEAVKAVAPNLSSTSVETRLVTLEALRHLAERTGDVYRNHLPGLFESSLADPSPDIRWRAAWAKGRLLESSPALRAAALDADELVAEAACEALGAAHDDRAFPSLLRALDRNGPVAKAATTALTRLTGREFPDADAWRTYIRSRESQRSGVGPIGS